MRPTRTRQGPAGGVWTAVLALLVTMVLTGCGADAGGDEGAAALTSSRDQAFRIVEHDGARYAVGHGISLRLPEGWIDYGPEQDSADGTAYEWAVGLPADTRPLPAGVQFSMGGDGKGVPFARLPEVTRQLAELAPGYRLLDEGESGVPGAQSARYLRIEKDLDLEGRTVRVEQLQVMLEMPGGQSAVVRFIAEAGQWKQQMQEAYDSLEVAEKLNGD